MAQTFDTITTSTDSPKDGIVTLDARTDTLRSSFSGASSPSTPVDGQLWFDTGNLVIYYYDGSQWVEFGTNLASDLDLNLNQLIDARLENTGSDPTPAAGNVGKVVYHTGDDKAKLVASATLLETLVSVSNSDGEPTHLPINTWTLDATNPPTATTVGTTPTVCGLLFDATNERMHISVPVPRGYSDDADLVLRVHFLLNATETANDTADFVVDLVSQGRESSDAATKTSTQATVSHDIGSNAGQYTYHAADIPIDFDDADNPVDAEDLLSFSLGMSALGGAGEVAAVIVTHVELLTPCGVRPFAETI